MRAAAKAARLFNIHFFGAVVHRLTNEMPGNAIGGEPPTVPELTRDQSIRASRIASGAGAARTDKQDPVLGAATSTRRSKRGSMRRCVRSRVCADSAARLNPVNQAIRRQGAGSDIRPIALATAY